MQYPRRGIRTLLRSLRRLLRAFGIDVRRVPTSSRGTDPARGQVLDHPARWATPTITKKTVILEIDDQFHAVYAEGIERSGRDGRSRSSGCTTW